MSEIFFDLSELFLFSGVKFKYYGIVRTVMEVAYELTRLDPEVRFVVYSPYHRRFFEVFPRVGDASPTGVLDPNLPASATPVRLRQSVFDRNVFKSLFYLVWGKIVDFRNRRRWAQIPDGAVREVDLNGKVLVSLGRPKLMSDYLTAMAEAGINIRFVPLLHDMIPLHDFSGRPDFKPPRNFVHDNEVAIRAAALILTNSHFSRREVLHFSDSGLLPPVPEVVAVPLCHEMRLTDEPLVTLPPEGRYLLGVGLFNGRKNLECVVEAMLELQRRGADVPDLVLAGGRRKKVETYFSSERFSSIAKHVRFVIDPNQTELRKLYEKAFALVLPSRMEGWGLPVGEALWCGTPALAADIPALREVGGDLALYFDPDKPVDLANLLVGLQADPTSYGELRNRISVARSRLRTWNDVAGDVLAAVRSLD